MTDITDREFPIVEQKCSFKLIKNAKLQYHWEIKIIDDDVEVLKTKIKQLDDWARTNYGGAQ